MTTQQAINPLWNETLSALSPYIPGEQTNSADLIKLNTNENPYPPSPLALAALRAAANADLRLYPDPEGRSLKQTIAAQAELDIDNVFLGNGSDEVLAHTFLALLKHPAPLLFPDITYSFYPVYCSLYQIDFETIALDDTLAINPQDYLRKNGGIIFPNPNAPTGRALRRDDIRIVLAANPGSVVVVDEAYIAFGAETAVPLIREFNNLLVIRTLSKSHALAGLRVGYALGDSGLIDGLNLVKGCFNSYPLDRLALAGAEAALNDHDYFSSQAESIIASRLWLTDTLERLAFSVVPSSANFLFVRHAVCAAEALQQALREHNILVRRFKHPRIDNYLRITVGTATECERLVECLVTILAALA